VRVPGRVHRVRARAVADVDLVPAAVADDHRLDDRRADLRGADGGHVRLAVAAL